MSDQFQGIQVTGTGKVTVTPDQASISLGVLAEEKTAQDAVSSNSKKMQEILKSLRAAGVEEKDISTSRFQVQPQWKYPKGGKPSVVGYQASNSIILKVKSLDKFPNLLDIAVKSGANSIDGISFSYSKDEESRKEALTKAMVDAKTKAQLVAVAEGLKLGLLISAVAQTADNNRYGTMRLQSFAAPANSGGTPPPLAAGELDLTTTVEAVYAIGDRPLP